MTKRAAVIGHPINHSKSPLIHQYWIEKYRLAATYEALDIAPEKLEGAIRSLAEQYAGFNVTLPHKEKILTLCDEIDELARNVGAVNTVTIENGKLYGTNTDVFGFTENIKSKEPGFDFSSGPAVILGAGGAARAIVYALITEGVPEIRIVNRTKEKAEILIKKFKNSRVWDWQERDQSLSGANLLVNTTSMGMKGQPELEMDLNKLPKTALVNDIVYAPLMTDLLIRAQDRGNKTVTGIGMLLHQARPAFHSWFGVMPDVDTELEKRVAT